MNIARLMVERGIEDRRLTFGRFKNVKLSLLDPDYIRWCSKNLKDSSGPTIAPFVADLRTLAQAVNAEADADKLARDVFSGRVLSGKDHPVYIIERDGDIDGLTLHDSRDMALAVLCAEYPLENGVRQTPDPEDDRILIWEVLPTGHKKVVWHFTGWHWSSDEFGLHQGWLPGDIECLYVLAMRD